MESPRVPMELGYPVRFGAGTAATVPKASKTAGRPLRNRRIVPPQALVPEAGSRACLEPDHSATAAPRSWICRTLWGSETPITLLTCRFAERGQRPADALIVVDRSSHSN